jgi:hypothetical protein
MLIFSYLFSCLVKMPMDNRRYALGEIDTDFAGVVDGQICSNQKNGWRRLRPAMTTPRGEAVAKRVLKFGHIQRMARDR